MIEKIINFVINSNTSDKIALLALLISIILPIFIQIWNNRREDKKESQQELFQRETQDKLDEFQGFQKEFSIYKQSTDELQFNLQNRSDLIPIFNLNRTKSRIFSNEDKLIVEIYLTNVGRGTATNIMTCKPNKDPNGIPIYFEQTPFLGKATHAFYNYFSENFAIPNESISFSLSEINQQAIQSYFLIFKIKFSDALGREYEQKFRFGYDNYSVNGINQDSTSYPPKLINDIN
ncbi:hypothetical protein [Streptococcus mitis]|uniref:hypothetical protein n=1 Tax=Streptococcus mitis TaxID=28037 RepID=UPI0020008FA8|nr:hypothetical protein [Streptococcus mitis]